MDKEYSNIKPLIEKEENHLHNILPKEDVLEFKDMIGELRDTWNKKQIFRTETEARMSVLQDYKYPTVASKYWQCVREQNVFLEQLMELSFRYRKNAVKIRRLEKKIETETDEYKKDLYLIDLDEKRFNQAGAELVAKDRMRELKMWSKLKKEFNNGSFDDKNVNTHQMNSYHAIMKNKAATLTEGSSQPEVFNVMGQLETIERIKTDEQLPHEKRKALSKENPLKVTTK